MQDTVPRITVVCAQCTDNPQSQCTGVILDEVFFSTNDLFPRSNLSRSAAVLAVVMGAEQLAGNLSSTPAGFVFISAGHLDSEGSTDAAFLGAPRGHSWTARPCTWPSFHFSWILRWDCQALVKLLRCLDRMRHRRLCGLERVGYVGARLLSSL